MSYITATKVSARVDGREGQWRERHTTDEKRRQSRRQKRRKRRKDIRERRIMHDAATVITRRVEPSWTHDDGIRNARKAIGVRQ